MHRAHPEAVIAKGLDRQRLERGPLLGKHGSDLALGRAVDAGVRPVRLPAIEIRLRLLQALEALAVERRLLRVADARFDLALAIGIADAARQADHAVVREDVAIQRIQRRLVDIRRQHAFFEIVEDDRPRRAAETPKRALMEFGPRLRTRLPRQQPHRFPRVREGQDKESCPSVLAGRRDAGPSAPRRSRPGPPRPAWWR